MVFSQTSQKTHSILNLIELDHLDNGKKDQDGLNGVVTTQKEAGPSSEPAPTYNDNLEEFLKTEPVEFDTNMYQNSDCEFFQDLGLWCSIPAKEEQVQTIDSMKPLEENSSNTDTLNTLFSSNGRDLYDASTPAFTSLYNNTSPISISSPMDGIVTTDKFLYPDLGHSDGKVQFQEQFLDIASLPVIFGDIASENTSSKMPLEAENWTNTHYTTDYTKPYINTYEKGPFIDQEDSFDLKLTPTVVPREVEWNDAVISEYILNDSKNAKKKVKPELSIDVSVKAPGWDFNISTPEVLSVVEQLERDDKPTTIIENEWLASEESTRISFEDATSIAADPDYEPITPKTESHIETDDDIKSYSSKKRRRSSEESDDSYTPYIERSPPKKYKRKKSSIPIKEMIQALEESRPVTKAKRGRPPKRRDSVVSSVCSIDIGSNGSFKEVKYREVRDKNNEASKRSRMNRKLKELQMEQLAIDLQERNKKLKVKADILEDMTKRLKDALMTAMLKQ